MSRFTDRLWGDLVRSQGPNIMDTAQPAERAAGRVLRRPRVLAGSTLGMAGVGAAIVLALGGSAAPAAFAVTRASDGSVLVKLSYADNQNLPQVNARLKAMGTHEQVYIQMQTGAAPVSGPVTCTPATGAARPSGPQVKILNGPDGTEVIHPGESAGNTAEGTFYLRSCVLMNDTYTGNTGAVAGTPLVIAHPRSVGGAGSRVTRPRARAARG